MESLAKQQKDCYEKIVKINTNYKKDSESRKTTAYVENRLEKLETLWEEFSERNEEIQKIRDTNPQHAYFTKNYFEEVKVNYKKIKDTLYSKLEELSKKIEEVTPDINTENEGYSKKLLRVQMETIKLIKRLLKSVENEIKEPRSSFYYQHKLSTIQTYWNKIMLTHTEIIANPNENYADYLGQNTYETLEDFYHKIVIQIQEQLGSTERNEDEVKLPRLILPIFEGDYQHWTSFRDIFLRLIHNNTRLGDAEKMQYLKTHLRKEAGSLIQHLTISNSNYQTAWQLLNDRFDNKRKICSTQLHILLSQPKLDQESANGVRKLYDTTRECLHALTNLGIDTSTWAPIITHIVLQKLDIESHKLYEQTLEKPRELPTNDGLFRFLETRFQSLELLKDSKRKEPPSLHQSGKTFQTRYRAYLSTTNKNVRCGYCQQTHKIYECQKFLRLSVPERKHFIRTKKFCYNCLSHKQNEKCRSKYTCNLCNQQHHTLLHLKESKDLPQVTQISSPKPKQEGNIQSLQGISNRHILLATALVKTRTINGTLEVLRALIDPGSQATFISEAATNILALPKFKANAQVSGLGLTNAGKVRYKVMLELSPRFPSQFSIRTEALVLPQLTKLLPNLKIDNYQNLYNFKNIVLADPNFYIPGPIDIIIGADIFGSILCEKVFKNKNGLLGQQTEFGWVLSGQVNSSSNETQQITSMISQVDLDKTLKRFWELEETESSPRHLREEDNICEEHFLATHKRNEDGSYTVKIPFKNNTNQLGDSKKKAMARLLQNERKFQRDKKLHTEYQAFMKEYIKLKHMIPIEPGTSSGYYLPHQAIIKEDSTTTRLRAVFDASSKTTTGVSLNDTMYSGPKLQNDLYEIILRWRQYRYVFTADIEKMYRQIKVHPEDQKFLKILWRASDKEPIKEYQLTTVTYGTAAAPFLAIRTLHQLAKDERETYPQASLVLLRDFYVDDMLTGAHSIREALSLQKELMSLLAAGGFKLRKWTTNKQSLLENIPADYREKSLLSISDGEPIKTLGLYWLPASDCFQFRVNCSNSSDKLTKRSVLSDIAKIFDPTGWLSPVVIRAKILMQKLWEANLDWDKELPSHLAQEWNQFRDELKTMETIKIPRWIKFSKDSQTLEFHGFCDASERAYAAVIYTRVCTPQGEFITTMFTAKTKVAPNKKQTSLPRLELCAAVLLAKLLKRAKTILNVKKDDIYLWTDSAIVLAWITGCSKKLDKFVSNKISEILEITGASVWFHVKSADNPADCASRGISPSKLKNHPLWWTGPKWLELPKEKWITPASKYPKIKDQTYPEIAPTLALSATMKPADIINQFSTLSKLIRILTYCRRFLKSESNRGFLKTDELNRTLVQCIKIVQNESFPLEMKSVTQTRKVPTNSKLKSLTPFVDTDGLLRLGGRLENSQLSYNQKHPIILPHSHHFTTLIIRDAHHKTLHGGNQATLAYIRRKYWIIDAQSAVKYIIHHCMKCCRFKASTSKQLMGQLPAPRVQPSQPFAHTGIDYAGPFRLRLSKGRGTKTYKGYISIFICLCTKAIHLEAVSDLTTDAFLAAYKRFIARRGLCTNIYSDCATTFVGARNELEREFKLTVEKCLKDAVQYTTSQGTQWHFIPPASPHFGGLWESGVKSTKHHLKRIAGEINWTFEEFSTLLAQIEACLNSRPLCPLTNDPDDLTVITPGHFLIGGPLVTPPEPERPEKAITLLTRWELIRKTRRDFWKIWSAEYLSRLQQRRKWQTATDNLNTGDIILVKEDNLPPGNWLLGRIESTHPGSDGLVRVVTIKTTKGIIKRPITKVCKLPLEAKDLPNPNLVPDQSTASDDNHTSMESEPCEVNRSDTNNFHTNIIDPTLRPTATSSHVATTHTMSRPRKRPRIYPTTIPQRPPIEELRRTALPTQRMKYSTLTTSLLLLNCVLGVMSFKGETFHTSSPLVPSIEIMPFEQNPGIYMEHIADLHLVNNMWNMIVYFDLSTYYLQMNGFEQCLEKLNNLCNKTTSYNYYCKSVVTELRHKVSEMKENNLILHKRNGNHLLTERHKRAPFEIIGTIQHSLFGVLDQSYANYIEDEISKIKENENYLLSLARNQTSITEVTANVLKKTTAQIQQQFEVLNNHITTNFESLKAGIEKNELQQTFTSMVAYMTLILNNYERVQKELIELLLDAHNGKISPFLVTPQQLRYQINYMREHIPNSLIIPGESNPDDLLNLYKTMTVQSRITHNTIIFRIQVPLPDEKLFQLFKLYPVPSEHNGDFFYIEPSTKYLASSLHRDLYYPLTQTELNDCHKAQLLGYLCKQQKPVYTIQAPINRCEMDLLNHRIPASHTCNIKKTSPSQYWIQLQNPNYWIFVVQEETIINIVCDNQVIIKKLNKSGIIKLQPNCKVKHPTMTIDAQTTLSNTRRASFLPLSNISTLLQNKKLQATDNITIPLVHLDTNSLDNLKFNNVKDNFPTVNPHHVHHYFITYTIIAIVILGFLWFKYPQLFRSCSKNQTTEEAFEVQTMTPSPARHTTMATTPSPPV